MEFGMVIKMSKILHKISTTILTFFFVLATQKVMITYSLSETLNNICIIIITVAWFIFCVTDDDKN